MSDYIKRGDAENIMLGSCDESALWKLRYLLPADVVEVIRCKDCKNYEHIVTAVDNKGNVTKECDFCNHWKRIIDVNDYCSYGQREG